MLLGAMHSQSAQHNSRITIQRSLITLLLVFLSIGAVLAVLSAYFAYSIFSHVTKLQTLATQLDFQGARNEVVLIQRDTDRLNQVSTPLLIPFQAIPVVDKQVRAIRTMEESSARILESAQSLFTIADSVIAPLRSPTGSLTGSGITASQRFEAMQALQRNSVTLTSVKAKLSLARLPLQQLAGTGLLPQIEAVRAKLDSTSGQVSEALEESIPRIDAILTLAGSSEEKTYLFLLQNNAEVRATGGFIGNYGIMKVAKGEITSFHTDNIYNIDDPAEKTLQVQPPEPIAKYFKTDRWFMRDSNWSPDFPTTARKAEEFYHLENGTEQHLDGVIAMTPDVIISLLKFTGPIVVEGVTYRAENFNEQLQFQVEQGFYQRGIPLSQRKEVVGVLAKIMMDKLINLPPAKWPEVLKIINTDLAQKQILVYLNKPAEQAVVQAVGWTGEVRGTDGDFLMVVDSNMLAQKTDAVMDKKITYRLTETENGEVHAKLTLTYKNKGIFSPYVTRYRDWVRVYVPVGSALLSSSGAMEKELSTQPGRVEVYPELGKTVFAGYIVIEPGQSKDFIFDYKLPNSIAQQIKRGSYHMLVQKQSGVQSQILASVLRFNHRIKSVGGPDVGAVTEQAASQLTWISDLHIDRELNVGF